MNPKFGVGEYVYFRDELFYVISVNSSSSNYSTTYIIAELHDAYNPIRVYEIELLSVDEWEVKQKGTQNNIGRIAFELSKYAEAKHSKSCVCGAHKVKDSAHSSWCDIKN